MALMEGRTCIVTGATSGIGEVTAQQLARMGAHIVMIVRDEEKAQRVQQEVQQDTPGAAVDYLLADLSSMAQVRRAAESFRERFDALHVLVNNAGAIFTNYDETVDGYERTFALNHLSYFLLTNSLLDLLKASGKPQQYARIINVASEAHQMAEIDWNDLQNKRDYGRTGMAAYSESKLANIMFSYELARRLEAEKAYVTANALHPGTIASGFGHNNPWYMSLAMTVISPFMKKPEQGAETPVYLATSPEVEGITGQYYSECQPIKSSQASYNQDDWARLWEVSEAMTGIREPV
jgi:NAD(P)-dependent dehydrogenase (short-subunit alcohol dehydrogenase family)